MYQHPSGRPAGPPRVTRPRSIAPTPEGAGRGTRPQPFLVESLRPSRPRDRLAGSQPKGCPQLVLLQASRQCHFGDPPLRPLRPAVSSSACRGCPGAWTSARWLHRPWGRGRAAAGGRACSPSPVSWGSTWALPPALPTAARSAPAPIPPLRAPTAPMEGGGRTGDPGEACRGRGTEGAGGRARDTADPDGAEGG